MVERERGAAVVDRAAAPAREGAGAVAAGQSQVREHNGREITRGKEACASAAADGDAARQRAGVDGDVRRERNFEAKVVERDGAAVERCVEGEDVRNVRPGVHQLAQGIGAAVVGGGPDDKARGFDRADVHQVVLNPHLAALVGPEGQAGGRVHRNSGVNAVIDRRTADQRRQRLGGSAVVGESRSEERGGVDNGAAAGRGQYRRSTGRCSLRIR